ncbi:ABC transporter permease [Murimonas intestini]|uniref:ABC transporter permease n=1 Tax=Murimonas intestini TaxID=1337051 RepID=UPI0011DDD0EA|nr:ABC transporter permease [Murimonas intestini]
MKFVNKKLKIGVSVLAVFLILGFIVPLFGPENPTEWGAYLKNMPPSSEHLLGTTSLGQDTFFLLAHSINNSFKIGIAVSLIATAAGVFLGLIAGFKSGLIDRLISLLTDSFIVIPSLPILILLSSFLKGTASVSFIVAILALFSWPLPARQVRSMALSLRERESINMALFSGESMVKIIVREIFPYISGWTLANFVNGILAAIAAESTLAVIGMSSNSTATLGTMIYWANQYQAMLGGRWLWIGTPVVATVIIFISLFLTMNGYQEYMAKRRGKNA